MLMVTAAMQVGWVCVRCNTLSAGPRPGRRSVDPACHQGSGTLSDQWCSISSRNKDLSWHPLRLPLRTGIKVSCMLLYVLYLYLFIPWFSAFSLSLRCAKKRPENRLPPTEGLSSTVRRGFFPPAGLWTLQMPTYLAEAMYPPELTAIDRGNSATFTWPTTVVLSRMGIYLFNDNWIKSILFKYWYVQIHIQFIFWISGKSLFVFFVKSYK